MGKVKRAYGYIKRTKHDPDTQKIVFTEEHVDKFHAQFGLNKNSSATSFDLRNVVHIPASQAPYNQALLGSCSANASTFAEVFDQLKQGNKEPIMGSRLMSYYNSRALEGTTDTDAGAQICDAIKSIAQYGYCSEKMWPYDPSKFAVKPPEKCYNEGKIERAIKFFEIDLSADTTPSAIVSHLKNALKSGYPIVFGFVVFSSFESDEVAQTGMMPMPQPDEEIMGGHAVVAVGYDDSKNAFIIRNSWGTDWGLGGYFYMPYEFISIPELASEFWIVQGVSNPTNIPNYSPDDLNVYALNLDYDPSSGGVVNNN